MEMYNKSLKAMDRRKFMNLSSQSLLASSITVPALGAARPKKGIGQEPKKDLTIQQVIDKIMAQIPGETNKETVDTVKIGDVNQPVTGIVSTFMATVDVIKKAKWLGANLIITHEPTFYNHLDETDWLEKDQVYQFKKALLEEGNIVVWRFHTFWHQYRPDGILTGFLKRLSWEDYYDEAFENTCVLPEIELKNLAQHLKEQFQLKRTFYIGDPGLPCKRVGILPGAWGGRAHISFLDKNIDAIIVGESAEWETVEYVRDAASAGFKKGLIIMGHEGSEEPGMAYLKEWLEPLIPGIKISHISAGDPFVPV